MKNINLEFLRNLTLLPLFFLVSCGGSGGGGAPSTSSPDLLNLYPTFELDELSVSASVNLATSLYNPFVSPQPLETCNQGSASSDWVQGKPPVAGAVAHITYTNCIIKVDTTDPLTGQLLFSTTTTKNGVITYTLNSFGGDFLTMKNAANVNLTTAFNGFSQNISMTIGTQAPIVFSNAINGAFDLIYTGYDFNGISGKLESSNINPVTVDVDVKGVRTSTSIKSSRATWNYAATQVTRSATEVILPGKGQYAGHDVIFTNLNPVIFTLGDPDAILQSDKTLAEASRPSSGLDVLTFGSAKVYLEYKGQNLSFSFDQNGDGCIENTAILTWTQFDDFMLKAQPLPSSLLVPVSGSSCVPIPTVVTPKTSLVGGAMQGIPLNLAGTVSTIAGSGVAGTADGRGTNATFTSPHSITTDGTNLYVGELRNGISGSNYTIRKMVIATGQVTTVASFASGYGGNITTDGKDLYFASPMDGVVRKIVVATGEVAAVANTNYIGYGGITTDGVNLYLSSYMDSTVRKIAIATGQETILVGAASGVIGGTGITTDGTNLYVGSGFGIRKILIATGQEATLATLSSPSNGSITSDGINLYFSGVNTNTIYKIIIATGQVTTLAGSNMGGYLDGNGAAAQFNNPTGITTDGINLYVTDMGNHTIRKIK